MIEQPMEEVNQVIAFEVGMVKTGKQQYNNWEVAWKKLKKYLEEREKQNRRKISKEKKMQKDLVKDVDDDEYR